MSTESFKILKEINSLSMRVNELNDLIANENKRVTFIERNRASRESERDEFLKEKDEQQKVLVKTENDIATNSSKIAKDKENLSTLMDAGAIQSLEKQINDSEQKLDALEEEGLLVLEKIEELEKEIDEASDFLQGSLESLSEIKIEVTNACKAYQEEIDQLSSRVELLKVELPPLFQSKLELTLSKNIPISNFTRIKDESCEFCRYGLSKMDTKSIEDQLNLKICQSCSRIFLPKASF